MQHVAQLAIGCKRVGKEKVDQLRLSKTYRMVILDDLSWVVHHGYLDMDLVARALRARRRDVHVVLAGRYMPMEWLDMADMATEMRQVTHPYPKKAIAPQAGVDF